MPFLIIGIVMCLVVNVVGDCIGASIPVLLLQVFIGAFIYLILGFTYLTLNKSEQVQEFRMLAVDIVMVTVGKVFKHEQKKSE